MKELGELLIEIAQTLDANYTVIKNLSTEVESLNKRIDELSRRIKELEGKKNSDLFEELKKIGEQQPKNPWKVPTWPSPVTPFPPSSYNKCSVCGMDYGSNQGYVCPNGNCPTRITWTNTPTTWTNLDLYPATSQCTCACGENQICQCNK